MHIDSKHRMQACLTSGTHVQAPELVMVVDEDGDGLQHLRDVHDQHKRGTWVALRLSSLEHINEAIGTLHHCGGVVALEVVQDGSTDREPLIVEVQRRAAQLPRALAANLLLTSRCDAISHCSLSSPIRVAIALYRPVTRRRKSAAHPSCCDLCTWHNVVCMAQVLSLATTWHTNFMTAMICS